MGNLLIHFVFYQESHPFGQEAGDSESNESIVSSG